ncbi:MAG: protease modulator HflK family protein [Thermoanaerobaculales bacterium]|nr:protease modulator HflK family protein [Thermoanaerobaculales bacterium]
MLGFLAWCHERKAWVDIRVRTALISTGLNFVLTVAKFVLFAVTGSLAILAEAWHSCADVGTSLVVLLAVRQSKETPDGMSETDDEAPSTDDDTPRPDDSPRVARLRLWLRGITAEQWAAFGIGVFLSVIALGLLRKVLLGERAVIAYPLLSGILFLCFAVGSYFVFRFETTVGHSCRSVGLVSDGLHSKADMVGALLAGVAMLLYALGLDVDRPVAVLISLFVLSFGVETLVHTVASITSRNERSFGELRTVAVVLSLFEKERLHRFAAWVEKGSSIPVLSWARSGLRGLRYLRWVAAAAVVLGYLSSSVYTVATTDAAFVERFGRPIDGGRTIGPGVHLKAPWPIDRVVTVDVHSIRTIALGNVTKEGAFALIWTQDHGIGEPFLAGDNTLFYPYLLIHYRVRDMFTYTMNHVDADELLSSVADSGVSSRFASMSFDDIVGSARRQLEDHVRNDLQTTLDELESGLEVVGVYFKDVHPPIFIADAFERVIAARQEKQQQINIAHGYRNQRLPEARGEAARSSELAQAFILSRVLHAEGDASRFLARRVTGRRQRAITERRLHLEAIGDVVTNSTTVVVDPNVGMPTMFLDGATLRGAGSFVGSGATGAIDALAWTTPDPEGTQR